KKWACWTMTALVVSGCSGDGGNSSPGASGFQGVCLGAKHQFYDDSQYGDACRAYFNDPATCAKGGGGAWTARTFCSGFPTTCRNYTRDKCATQPGCAWYGPPDCSDEASCNEYMYVDEGQCALVPRSYAGACSGKAYIDLAALCGSGPSAPAIMCG